MDFKTEVVKEICAYIGYNRGRNARIFPGNNVRCWDAQREVTRVTKGIFFECIRTFIQIFKNNRKVTLLEIKKVQNGG